METVCTLINFIQSSLSFHKSQDRISSLSWSEEEDYAFENLVSALLQMMQFSYSVRGPR